ncbi:MAG: hypothetical protein Q7S83_03235 [bacterium]|nr:hypothetical protein [bacterium]
MKKNAAILYVAGITIALALMIYVIYLLNFLLQNLSAISGADIRKTPEIATFDLEGFQKIQKAQ